METGASANVHLLLVIVTHIGEACGAVAGALVFGSREHRFKPTSNM